MKFLEFFRRKLLLKEANLVNHQDFKRVIDIRYAEKIKHPEGRKWFNKNFIRWYSDPTRSHNDIDVEYKVKDTDPEWMKEAEKRGEKLYFFRGFFSDEIEHNLASIVNWFNDPDFKDHGLLNQKSFGYEDAVKKALKFYPKTMKEEIDEEVVYTFDDGWTIKKILSDRGLKREGHLMNNCMLSYTMDDLEDDIIYSLRDTQNNPHATIEYDDGLKGINQIKGNLNDKPKEAYVPYIVEFIKANNFKVKHDGAHIGWTWDFDKGEYELKPKTFNVDLFELIAQEHDFPSKEALLEFEFNSLLGKMPFGSLLIRLHRIAMTGGDSETFEEALSLISDLYPCLNKDDYEHIFTLLLSDIGEPEPVKEASAEEAKAVALAIANNMFNLLMFYEGNFTEDKPHQADDTFTSQSGEFYKIYVILPEQYQVIEGSWDDVYWDVADEDELAIYYGKDIGNDNIKLTLKVSTKENNGAREIVNKEKLTQPIIIKKSKEADE
jgi:hypothetical protein